MTALAQSGADWGSPLPWITIGVLLGLVLGFLYAAVRHAVRRRRGRP